MRGKRRVPGSHRHRAALCLWMTFYIYSDKIPRQCSSFLPDSVHNLCPLSSELFKVTGIVNESSGNRSSSCPHKWAGE